MDVVTISPKQYRAAKFMTDPKRQRTVAPTLEELCTELGLASKQSAYGVLKRLVDKGVIEKDGDVYVMKEPPERKV